MQLLEAATLTDRHKERIAQALEELLFETDYQKVERDSRFAITVSLTRAECVRLAAALQQHGAAGRAFQDWLSAASIDPLPEVRFAVA